MPTRSNRSRTRGNALLLALTALTLALAPACASGPRRDDMPELQDLATRYAAAWSGQDPDALAAFYAEDGRLVVNDGEPSVGRAAIAATARGFMEAFPDMVVRLRNVTRDGGQVLFHWNWTGTNTGPGGNGRAVDLDGLERWTLDLEGRIAISRGSYDESEYARQMGD